MPRSVGVLIEALREIDDLWGNAMMGLAITEHGAGAFSVDQIVQRTGISDDTVRRHLERLVDIGRVSATKAGRLKNYQAVAPYPQKTLELIQKLG